MSGLEDGKTRLEDGAEQFSLANLGPTESDLETKSHLHQTSPVYNIPATSSLVLWSPKQMCASVHHSVTTCWLPNLRYSIADFNLCWNYDSRFSHYSCVVCTPYSSSVCCIFAFLSSSTEYVPVACTNRQATKLGHFEVYNRVSLVHLFDISFMGSQSKRFAVFKLLPTEIFTCVPSRSRRCGHPLDLILSLIQFVG